MNDGTAKPPPEQKGIVSEVIVPIVVSGVGGTAAGTANAIVSNVLNKPKK
jgi:hypothetical protein